jgi:hypothetical protein
MQTDSDRIQILSKIINSLNAKINNMEGQFSLLSDYMNKKITVFLTDSTAHDVFLVEEGPIFVRVEKEDGTIRLINKTQIREIIKE